MYVYIHEQSSNGTSGHLADMSIQCTYIYLYYNYHRGKIFTGEISSYYCVAEIFHRICQYGKC